MLLAAVQASHPPWEAPPSAGAIPERFPATSYCSARKRTPNPKNGPQKEAWPPRLHSATGLRTRRLHGTRPDHVQRSPPAPAGNPQRK